MHGSIRGDFLSTRGCEMTRRRTAEGHAVWCGWRRSVPGGAGGGGGGRSELVVLLWAAVGGGLGGGPLSFIPNSLDSLERVRGSEDPREALGDSVFRVLEL